MSKATYIKVDGVSLNIDWVKGMTLAQFKKNEQVNRLFHRIKGEAKPKALETYYETITGRKGKPGGNDASTTVTETATPPAPLEGSDENLANGLSE